MLMYADELGTLGLSMELTQYIVVDTSDEVLFINFKDNLFKSKVFEYAMYNPTLDMVNYVLDALLEILKVMKISRDTLPLKDSRSNFLSFGYKDDRDGHSIVYIEQEVDYTSNTLRYSYDDSRGVIVEMVDGYSEEVIMKSELGFSNEEKFVGDAMWCFIEDYLEKREEVNDNNDGIS